MNIANNLRNFDSSKFKGFSFGIVSGAITTLGMMVGLDAGTQSKFTVILGVLTIAIADALSDALGVHVSEESDRKSVSQVWKSTLSTFTAKFFFALTFVIPLILLDLNAAIIASVFYGLVIIGILSYLIAKKQNEVPYKVIIEHLFIAIIVIIISYLVGNYFSQINVSFLN